MKLLLFDIDGTILYTHGLGRQALETALTDLFGRPITTKGVVFSGKTDPQIIREVLSMSGLTGPELEEQIAPSIRLYEAEMSKRLQPENVSLLPGLRPLIERLHEDPEVRMGLLTGNLEKLAYKKLEMVGLEDYFPFGAFGSDHENRNELARIAVDRAVAQTGIPFSGSDIIIIGDTEHDIICGRSVGAYCVAVCTGNYSRDDLEVHEPDLIFESLEEYEHFLEVIATQR